jgi:3-isopropylmalate/(R)-2-methylmalate dehydratase large subunit
VSAKDVMLHMLSQPFFKTGRGIGKVLEFAGEGVQAMPFDERATLTNMAVEAGGFTGIIEPGPVVLDYLSTQRGLIPADELRGADRRADADARLRGERFDHRPRDDRADRRDPGRPPQRHPPADRTVSSTRTREGKIDIAYGGILHRRQEGRHGHVRAGRPRKASSGLRVPDGVKALHPVRSQKIRDYAETMGYVALFEQAGVELIDPSCGACIKAGPGVSDNPDQVSCQRDQPQLPGR